VVGLGGHGVRPLMISLDINDESRFFDFACNQYVRVRYVKVMCLFHHLLLIYCYVVFIWRSTQAKRKLWRLVSLASGREPS